MIKKSIYYILLVSLLGCQKEVAIPITASFDIVSVQNNFTIPAKISINNTTKGAEVYNWTFEGGEPASSIKKNPGEVIYKKSGIYTINLIAKNFDGVQTTLEKKVTINNPISVDYSFMVEGNSFAPTIVNFKNLSSGSDKFEWTFEGGNPATSILANPQVTFDNGGVHKVSLKVSNPQTSVYKDSSIVLEPELTPNFEIEIPKQFEELEAPSEIIIKNNSIGNTTNTWTVEGADMPNSQSTEPIFRFSKPGTFTIQLQVGNGKKSKTISKSISIKPNKGYGLIKDIKFGIFAARSNIGVYYSSLLRKSFTEADIISPSEAISIDLAFFGLNSIFTINQFISPNEASKVGLNGILGATQTIILNTHSVVSTTVFEKANAEFLKSLPINKADEIDSYFDNSLPRLILFENSQKKKGLILIKSFVNNGNNSYLIADVKIQQ